MDFIDLTRFVKSIPAGSQLQAVRSYRVGEGWLLGLEFYPEPGFVLVGLTHGNSSDNSKVAIDIGGAKPNLSPSPCPLQLYLKAHCLNQRVADPSGSDQDSDGAIGLQFAPGQCRWRLAFERGELRSEIEVPDRKLFSNRLKLAVLPTEKSNIVTDGQEILKNAVSVSAAAKKKARVLKAVQSDYAEAQKTIEKFGRIAEVLKENPLSWVDGRAFSSEDREFIEAEIIKGQLLPFARENVAQANKHVFGLLRRAHRRIEGASKRLREVESRDESAFLPPPITQRSANASQAEKEKLKEPGIWVELKNGIRARVGKSATENAQLFRLARDRDLWFHVRGLPGGHVWIPRGQKGFGAKDEPSQLLIEEGAKLALFNSKAKSGGSATVDYTERRYLKSQKGASPGTLEILRSQTRHVTLDEAFESRLKGK